MKVQKVNGYQPLTLHNYSNRSASFSGLTDRMGKKIYNGFYDMAVLFPKEKTKNPIVGKLPKFMTDKMKFKTDNLQAGIKEVLDTFGEVSNELRDFEPTASSKIAEITHRRSDSTVKKLEAVLQKYGIIGRFDDFDIQYIDKGGKGSVWKLQGLKHIKGYDEDEFVIKVFHTKSIQANTYHGCYPEINAANFWMKKLGYDTNRGKFYWGDVNEAYMINKFIDEDVRLPKYVINPYDYGVKFTDEDLVHIHNVCKNYSYDWGGAVVINQVVNSNKFARNLMNKIKDTEEKFKVPVWYNYYHKKLNGHEDNKFAGLALAIKYLDPKDRERCMEKCFKKRGKYTDRAIAYTLKYLPSEIAIQYYQVLVKKNEPVLNKILANEIPLLSVKDEYQSKVHDDLIVLGSVSKSNFSKYIDNNKLALYSKIAKEYKLI